MAELPAVEAHDLVKVFTGKREVRALDGVSLEVGRGTVLGLLGPNGAGKTTAVRILSTILAPNAGRASVLGHDVVREAGTVRRLIGLAGQYATVDENLTGKENIKMVGRLTHMSKATSACAGRRAAGPVRPHRRRQPDAQDVLGGDAPPPGPGRGPGGPAAGALPRRAHHRARPAEPPGPLGGHRGAGTDRDHGAAHHPVPRGGGPPGRPGGGDRPRPGHRRGHPVRAQGRPRGHGDRGDPARPRGGVDGGHPARPAGRGGAPRWSRGARWS